MEAHRVAGDAPCVGATDLFFGPESDLRLEVKAEKAAREDAAREVCQTCFMTWECLSGVLLWESMQEDKEERFGVWGGLSPGDRRDFVRWMKGDIGKLWREGVIDLDYLEEETEAFLWARREERRERAEEAARKARQRKRAKQEQEAAPSVAIVVSISTGRRNTRSRPVPAGNGARGGQGRQRAVGAPAKNIGRAAPKAASPKRIPS